LLGFDGAEKVNGTQLMSATDPQKQMFCFQDADCISALRESGYTPQSAH
ncbi:MAG: hypothetical protein HRU15_13360, partial [Planctomycetes bacterium]|nr:hypothetical protein [Planctomycetota bacterium]